MLFLQYPLKFHVLNLPVWTFFWNSTLQVDFAMGYFCEYQDEGQSALWCRESVMVFTAAMKYNSYHISYCFTYQKQRK